MISVVYRKVEEWAGQANMVYPYHNTLNAKTDRHLRNFVTSNVVIDYAEPGTTCPDTRVMYGLITLEFISDPGEGILLTEATDLDAERWFEVSQQDTDLVAVQRLESVDTDDEGGKMTVSYSFPFTMSV